MNDITDIVQIMLLCAIIFIPLGYSLHRRFPNWYQNWQNRLLSPRYLKPAGLWTREDPSSQTKRKNHNERK
ncbi:MULTISPECIES: cellulose biosynthesis protein BcsF [unclassified Serratia (in: enterobacteria)]|uniref:cellulose biosynthesis protein BcsF n=1 Tax=unclassified Serratia (in: enterobacteria) TaxID=2647522 RepID=UPI003076211C